MPPADPKARDEDGDATGEPDDDALRDLVWKQLRAVAARMLAQERVGHTLQPTALVNEAWLRLLDTSQVDPADRQHFLALAARCMRRVLIDHARKRDAARRGGGGRQRVTLHPDLASDPGELVDMLALGEALERLSVFDARCCRVVELRFFGGMTEVEAAEVLGVTERTVRSDWRTARAWLHRELAPDQTG